EVARQGDRLGRREPAVHLDQQVDLGSDRVAYRLHERDRPGVFVARQLTGAGTEGVKLHRPVSTGHDPAGGLGELLGAAPPLLPAVRVRFDPVPARAAEKPVDRLVERLADHVPAGHLHYRERGHLGGAGDLKVVARDAQDQVLKVEWVTAEDVTMPDGL